MLYMQSMVTHMTRREVREVAFMVLFQTEFHSDVDIDATVKQYYTLDDDSTDTEDEDTVPTVSLSQTDRAYIEAVAAGVKEHKKEIDDIISEFARGWTVERLIKVDVAVLRYGIFEMTYMQELTPPEVSINEAVEISKKYGTEKSKAFVNGVLSSYYKKMKGIV